MSPKLIPKFEMAQVHYDLSDEFFRLFQDPTQTLQLCVFRAGRHDPGRGAARED